MISNIPLLEQIAKGMVTPIPQAMLHAGTSPEERDYQRLTNRIQLYGEAYRSYIHAAIRYVAQEVNEGLYVKYGKRYSLGGLNYHGPGLVESHRIFTKIEEEMLDGISLLEVLRAVNGRMMSAEILGKICDLLEQKLEARKKKDAHQITPWSRPIVYDDLGLDAARAHQKVLEASYDIRNDINLVEEAILRQELIASGLPPDEITPELLEPRLGIDLALTSSEKHRTLGIDLETSQQLES